MIPVSEAIDLIKRGADLPFLLILSGVIGGLLGTLVVPFIKLDTEEDREKLVELGQKIIDFFAENALEHERTGEMIERIGLVNFLEGIGLDVDPHMINTPRTNPYVRTDGWDDEVARIAAKKAAEEEAEEAAFAQTLDAGMQRLEGYLKQGGGTIDGEQLFTAKELTVDPGTKVTVKDSGAYGLICVQGKGTINGQPLNSPKLIRFTELTEDEYFCTEDGARAGVQGVAIASRTTEPRM